ncbi:MAG: ArnT family glycosyltransferase [Chloroflexota bacterium]
MRTAVLLYAIALVVRLVLIALFPDPAYPDSFYYVDVARQIAAGHGFNVDVVWIFAEVGGAIPAHPVLPIPSNAHWMPLASIVQVPFIWLLGPTALASALPFAFIGALVAPLTRAIARDAGATPLVATGAALLTAFPGLSLAFMVQPDNFSLFQPLVAASLWMAARGLKGEPIAFILAGLLAGLATLSRNDGLLVFGVLLLAVVWDRWRAWRSGRWGASRIPLGAVVASVALFAVVIVPWYARQLAVFGQLSPSTASGKVLFIQNIGEWDSITTPATLQHLLAQGWPSLLASRVDGLVNAIVIFSVLVGVVVLVPFGLMGAWRRRRSVDFGPYFTYVAVLFAFSAIISAVHVPGGTFIHSAVALAPHGYILALEGVAAAVAWVAARRPRWNVQAATFLFTTTAVIGTAIVGYAGALAVHGTWDARRDRMAAVDRALDAHGAPVTDRLMSIDAAGYRYATGRPGVVLVNDPLPAIEQVARAYGIRWLVLERDDAVPSVEPLLRGKLPPWVGPPVWRDTDEAPGTTSPTDAPVRVALFPICTTAGDPRCTRPPTTGLTQ